MNTTCLIIDDEKLARELLHEYLEGFPEIQIIGECAKGNEAVERINKLKPDLIFLDVQMHVGESQIGPRPYTQTGRKVRNPVQAENTNDP